MAKNTGELNLNDTELIEQSSARLRDLVIDEDDAMALIEDYYSKRDPESRAALLAGLDARAKLGRLSPQQENARTYIREIFTMPEREGHLDRTEAKRNLEAYQRLGNAPRVREMNISELAKKLGLKLEGTYISEHHRREHSVQKEHRQTLGL